MVPEASINGATENIQKCDRVTLQRMGDGEAGVGPRMVEALGGERGEAGAYLFDNFLTALRLIRIRVTVPDPEICDEQAIPVLSGSR